MSFQLYNTPTRRKEPFTPLDAANVRMYVCGPTVYDRAHIGNARPVVVYDVLFRLLRHVYGENHVTYVRNITDVDDKINTAAQTRGVPIETVTEETIGYFHEDMAALGALPPTHEPRATAYIAPMQAMIAQLVEAGYAYVASDAPSSNVHSADEEEGAHVLFHVPSMPEYGALSGRDREEMIAGARVEVAPYKKDPADFVLWKPSSADEPGWDSPWGRGRPGWHIECSAMSTELLGRDFDIHGGGRDLTFPHHENEIAQSVCAHPGSHYARYWVHNGFLTVNGEKMSKSLGNFITVRQLLDKGVDGEVIRYVLLSTHYRKPLDFSEKALEDAKKALGALYEALYDAGSDVAKENVAPDAACLEALEDDLNTPACFAALHGLKSAYFKATDAEEKAMLAGRLRASGKILGLLQQDPAAVLGMGGEADDPSYAHAAALADQRIAAKQAKDYARADDLRAEIERAGFEVRDVAGNHYQLVKNI